MTGVLMEKQILDPKHTYTQEKFHVKIGVMLVQANELPEARGEA